MNGSIQRRPERTHYTSFDEILDTIGAFGRYQIFTCVIIQLSTIMWAGSTCFLYLAMVEPDIRCDDLFDDQENITWDDNYDMENGPVFVTPTDVNYCSVYSNCSKHALTTSNTVFFSPVEEWLLICDRVHIQKLIIAVYFAGRIIGSFLGGHFGDYVGRKKGFFAAQFFILLSSVMSIASRNWITLAACQCVNGFMFGVIIVTSYALMFEYTSNRYSLIANASFQYCIGYIVVAGVGAITKNWRYYLIFVNLISAPLVVAYLLFLESPRYLIVKGKLHQAADVLTNLASERWNNRKVEFWPEELTNVPRDDTGRFYGFLHLFSTRSLLLQSLLQVLSTFTCSIISSTLSFNQAPTGLFLLFVYFGLFQLWIPLVMILLDFHVPKCGRRHFYLSTLGFSGFCLAVVLLSLLAGADASSPLVYVVSLVAIIVNASGYFMSVLHITVVVYPTVIRCTAFAALQIINDLGTLLGRLGFEKLVISHWIGCPYVICLCLVVVNFVVALKYQIETKNMGYAERIEDLKGERRRV